MTTAPRTARVAPTLPERLSYLAQRQGCAPYAVPLNGAWWVIVHDGAAEGRAPRLFVAARPRLSEVGHITTAPPLGGFPAARLALAGVDANVRFPFRCYAGELLGWLDGLPADDARAEVAGADVDVALLGALLRAWPGEAANPPCANLWARTVERPDLAERAGESPLYLHLRAEGWAALLRAVPPAGLARAFRTAHAPTARREAVAPC